MKSGEIKLNLLPIRKKGRLVAVDGRIANRRWTDKMTNQEKESFYVVANTIRLLGSKKDAETEAVL